MEKSNLTPQENINLMTHLLELGVIDSEAYLNLTGIEVSDKLRDILKEASKHFMPMIPLAMQAQIRLECELAKLNKVQNHE